MIDGNWTGRARGARPVPCFSTCVMMSGTDGSIRAAAAGPGPVAARVLRARVASVVVAALLAAASVVPVGAGAQQANEQRLEIREVVFRGVETFDADAIQESIVTRPSSCQSLVFRVTFCPFIRTGSFWDFEYLDRTELQRDLLRIRAFYWLRGYRHAEVDTLVIEDDDQATVVFGISEGEPTRVTSLTVQVADTLVPIRQRERLLRLQTGEPLDYLQLDTTLAGLRNALWERGYADAVVDTVIDVDSASRTATVGIRIDPRWQARVGSITIEGLQQLDPATVRRRLQIAEGDLFRRTQVFASQRNLYESALFRRATITTDGADSVKDLTITVSEAELNRVSVSGGFSTVDFLLTEAQYTNLNFFGRTRRFNAKVGVGNLLAGSLEQRLIFTTLPFPDEFDGDRSPFLRPTWLVNVDVRQPAFGSPRNSISIGGFTHRRSSAGIFIDRGYGGSATFTREVVRRLPVSLSYRFEQSRVEAGTLYFCVNFGVCDPPTINALQSPSSLSPIELSATTDRWNNPLNPTRGYTARLSLEHASEWTASDFSYNRLTLEATGYRPTGAGTLAARLRIGAVGAIGGGSPVFSGADLLGRPIIHPRKVFFAGGSRSVRGFGENLLGPKIVTIPRSALDSIGCVIPITGCDLNAVDANGQPILSDAAFTLRPLGARSVIEGNIEYRFPLAGQLSGAVFVDGAVLGNSFSSAFSGADGAITPGFGIRYLSPVGPIRVDVGFNPTLREPLPVVTQIEGPDGRPQTLLILRDDGSPALRSIASNRGGGILGRAVLHLSIGQAF